MRKCVYAHAALFSVSKLVYKRLLFAVILYCLWGEKKSSSCHLFLSLSSASPVLKLALAGRDGCKITPASVQLCSLVF